MDHSRSPNGCRKRSASCSAEEERSPKRRHTSPEVFCSGPRGRSRVRRESRLRKQRAQELLREQDASELPTLREQGPTSTSGRKRSRSSSEDEDEVNGTQPPLKKQRAASKEMTGVFGGLSGWLGSGSGMRPRGLDRPSSVSESESDDDSYLPKRVGVVEKEMEKKEEFKVVSESEEIDDLPDYEDDENTPTRTYLDIIGIERGPDSFDVPTFTSPRQPPSSGLIRNPTFGRLSHPSASTSPAAHPSSERASSSSANNVPSEQKTSASEQAYSSLQPHTSENAAFVPQKVQALRDSDPQLSETTNAVTNHLEDLRPSASSPPSFTEEEVKQMMARHRDEGNGPDADDFEILRLVLEELEDRMDVDTDDDADTFYSKQKEIRERLRSQRDAELREVKELERLRESVSGRRRNLDEASNTRPHPPAQTSADQDDYYLADAFFTDPTEELKSQKARLSEAEEHWKSPWPNPRTLSSQHWTDEASKFQNNERTARDVHEQIYWSNLRIQACAYAKKDIEAGISCSTQIRVALLDWKRSVAAAEATIAAAKQVGGLSVQEEGSPEDARAAREAPLREKLGRLLTQLPPELDHKVTKILDISTNQVITKTVESVNITRRDIAKILHSANFPSPPSDPPGWLNDEIINAFFAALTKALNDKSGYVKSPSTVPPYVTYNSSWLKSVVEKGNDITAIQRWSRRKGITGNKALKCKRIFFPVNPGNHWTLLVISPDTREIEYLDSLDTGTSTTPRKATRYINLARAWLKMELGNEYEAEEWKELDRRSPIQDNGSDCGMFACLNGVVSALEFESPTEEFGPLQIPYARRALISMLDVGGFQDYFEL